MAWARPWIGVQFCIPAIVDEDLSGVSKNPPQHQGFASNQLCGCRTLLCGRDSIVKVLV